MNWISFAWTTPALLAGRKSVTRRDWHDYHAEKFHAGDHVAGFQRNPVWGGVRVAIVQLTRDPYRESTAEMTEQDFEDEGFAYLEEQGLKIRKMEPRAFFDAWREADKNLWTVRFNLVTVDPDHVREFEKRQAQEAKRQAREADPQMELFTKTEADG